MVLGDHGEIREGMWRMSEIQYCEDCEFIRLPDIVDVRTNFSCAKCKASKDKVLGRLSRQFQNEELQCSVMREAGDTCFLYMEKKHES